MKRVTVGLLLAVFMGISFCPAGFAEEGYFKQMGRTFTRGVKNIVSFPLEIPVTVRKHDVTDNGNPRFFRDTAGVVDGIFRSVTRLGCGIWDLPFSMVPGDQDSLPLEPETFF